MPLTLLPLPEKIEVLDITGVHIIPSYEYAIVFILLPTAIHFVLSHVIPNPIVLKIVVPNPVHWIPLEEYANVFVPDPPAI